MNTDKSIAPYNGGQVAGQLVPGRQAMPALFDPYGSPANYRGEAAEGPELFGVSVFEYLRILNKRKWLILGIVAAFVSLSAVRTLMQTPLYTATVRLQIDRNIAKIVQNGDVTPFETADADFTRTQYQILQSRSLAERTASTLKLGQDPDFLKPREFSILGAVTGLFRSAPPPNTASEASLEKAAAGVIMANRWISPVMGSRLVDVGYSDPSPRRAQQVATAYADSFVAANLDKRFQANASAKTFLEDKIAQLKIRLEESEKKMLDFARREQIVELNEKSSIAENNLAAANAALGNLVADRVKNEQLWRQVESVDPNTDSVNLPQILSNKVVDNLRGQRQALAIDYQEKLETFKPNYPTMLATDKKIKEIDQQIASEIQTIKELLKAAYETSLALENETKERIGTLRGDLLDIQNGSIQYNILKREVDTNRDLYTSLLQRYKEVDIAGGVGANNVFVVERAEVPGAPSSPKLLPALRFAFLIGLGIALGIVFVLERLDDKVRSPEQVEQTSGLSLLGVIPKVTDVEVEMSDLRSALSESYRSLCTALQFTTEHGMPRTLVVTSSGPAEGKSLTSVSIAKHFATMGRKVLLVDGDLRNPSLHVKLRRDNAVGFSNYLIGACSPPDAMQTTEIPNLAFMSSGPLPPNGADLLASTRLHSLLSIGLEVFDLIIIDGPPVMGLADAQLLSSAASATVFIVGAGQTRKALIRGALRRLQLSRGTIIGAVLTKYDVKAAGYGYGYGYGYGGYGYGYGAQNLPQGLSITHSGGAEPQARLTDVHGNS